MIQNLGLKKVPELGNHIFAKKYVEVPEENLVLTRAMIEYLEILWNHYQKASTAMSEAIPSPIPMTADHR